MPRTSLWRALALVGAFLLSTGLGVATAEPREPLVAEQEVWSAWSALSAFGDTLIAIWNDVGGSLDPFGGEKPTGQGGSGGVAPTPERE